MRRTGRYLILGTVLASMGTAGTYLAYADWSLPTTTVAVSAQAAKMPRGVTPSVAKQSKAAVVSWSAQELAPGVKMDHYVVTAHSVGKPALPDVSRPVRASGAASESVTFTASEVAGGRWSWTVTPRFTTWTGIASARSRELSFPAAAPADLSVAADTPTPAATPVVTPTASKPTTPSPAGKPATEPPTSPPAQQPQQPPVADEPPPAEPPPGPAEPAASSSAAADVPQQVG